jgi:hypothetical protein
MAPRPCDQSLGDLLLEHQGQRRPPWRPVSAKPFEQQRSANVVGKVGDHVRTFSGCGSLVDLERIAFDDLEAIADALSEFVERGNAPAVALDGYDLGTRIEERASEAARSGADFVDALALKRPWDRGEAREKLPIENEVLPECLARTKPMAGDDVAKSFRWVAQAASAR